MEKKINFGKTTEKAKERISKDRKISNSNFTNSSFDSSLKKKEHRNKILKTKYNIINKIKNF